MSEYDNEHEYPIAGKIAYDAYCVAIGGVSKFTGDRLPKWEDQDPDIQEAWHEAGNAVIDIWQEN